MISTSSKMSKRQKSPLFCNVLLDLSKEQIQYLMNKKDKQTQKKRRLKKLEEDFETKRQINIEKFQHKIEQSQKSKDHQIKQKIQKNKKKLEHVQKVNKKAHQEYHSIVQKGLQKRQQFYKEEISNRPKQNTKAETQQNFKKSSKNKALTQSKLIHSETSKQMETPKLRVDKQMKQLEEKIQKAKNNQMSYQKQMMNKLYQKNKHSSEVYQKIRSHSMIEEQKNFKQLYGKNEHIISVEERVKGLTQKHLNDRRKSFQQKIKKLHQNIRFIESEKNQKFASLQNKLSKIYSTNPLNQASANKSNSHRQRVMMNNIKLDQQKNLKAEEILKKHSEITAKNKIYKEKKDQILQAIKKVNPQTNQ